MASSPGRQALVVGVGVTAGVLLLSKLFGRSERRTASPTVGTSRYQKRAYSIDELRNMAIDAAANQLLQHPNETSWVWAALAASETTGVVDDAGLKPASSIDEARAFIANTAAALPPNAYILYWVFMQRRPDGLIGLVHEEK